MTTQIRAATVLTVAFLILLPLGVSAQNPPVPQAPVLDKEFSGNAAVATKEFERVFSGLSKTLNTPITGDVDEGLAEKIIAIRQASIDLGQVILAQGSDPELLRLAVAGIQGEAGAIANLRTWLNNRQLATSGNRPSAPSGR